MKKLIKNSKVTFNKSGSGSTSGKITIPSDFLKLMGIDKDNRDVMIIFENDNIIIQKVDQLK